MKLIWFIPIALLIPLRLSATDAAVGARVATVTINPREMGMNQRSFMALTSSAASRPHICES